MSAFDPYLPPSQVGGIRGFPFPEGDLERVNNEWAALQERIRAVAAGELEDPHAFERAVRWVLINTFGDIAKFHFEPEFHGRVHAAEQMLERLRELEHLFDE